MASSSPRRLYLPGVWCSSTRKRRHVTPCGSGKGKCELVGSCPGALSNGCVVDTARMPCLTCSHAECAAMRAQQHAPPSQQPRLASGVTPGPAPHVGVIVVEEVRQHLAAVIVGVD